MDWLALLQIFDQIWGLEARSLPKYPKIFGAINASWKDREGNHHEADCLDEIGQAYQRFKTAMISFRSFGQKADADFSYWPAKATMSIHLQSDDEELINRISKVVHQEFPFIVKYVFISYDTLELPLATYIARVLEERCAPGVSVFVAKRDIKPGENPYKIMLEKQLLQAEALIALCSKKSKTSPWLWWESSAVWARGGLVVPLFIDITANEFNGPITLVCQGRLFFEVSGINTTLVEIINKVCPGHPCPELSKDEISDLEGLKASVQQL